MSRVYAKLLILRICRMPSGPQDHREAAEPPHQRRAGAAHGYELRQELDRLADDDNAGIVHSSRAGRQFAVFTSKYLKIDRQTDTIDMYVPAGQQAFADWRSCVEAGRHAGARRGIRHI